MMEEKCEICQLLAGGGGEVIFETKYWRVVLGSDQAYLGRAYISLLEHKGSLPELTQEQLIDWQSVVTRYEGMVRDAFGATLFNWACLMNNAFKELEPLPHVHWHVWPRYAQAPTVDGAEYPDPNFAHQCDKSAHREVSADELAKIGAALRA